MMPEFTPVDNDPFADSGQPKLTAVEHDPFEATPAKGLGAAIARAWDKPPQGLSLIGLAKGIYESGKSAVTLPRDVYEGRVDPESDEGVRRAFFDLGMLGLPATPARGTGAALARAAGVGKESPAANLAPAIANQAAAKEFNVDLSKGQATGDLGAIRYEDMAARGAYGKPAQEMAAPFFEQQFQDIGTAGRGIGEKLAREGAIADAPNAAGATLNAEIAGRATQARAGQQVAQTEAEREAAAQRGMLGDQRRVLDEAVAEGHMPIEAPRETGEIVGHELRSAAQNARQNYQGLYDDAFSRPGQFHAGTFEGIGNRIQGQLSLHESPVIIDDVTTPIASRAIRDLDNISNLRIQNRADPFGQPNPENIVAVDLRGVDQARKRLVMFYQAARRSNNPSDARAVGRMIDEFDGQVESAMTNGLFSGDEGAVSALQQARAAYSRYARTFRPQQAGDDVGTAIRRIVDRNATPEEIANMVIGSGRIGNAGLPVRLAERLEQIFGRDSDAWSAIRQGIWQRSSQVRNAAGEIDAARSAQGITDLVGSSLGQRMFGAQERTAMRAHAQGIRDLDRTIETLAATRNAEQARAGYQAVFGGEGIGAAQGAVFRRIVEGGATPEETAQVVFGAIGSGNPGNVSRMIGAIERIVGPNSEAMAAVRQGVWQKLTQHAVGKDQPGQQKISQAINEFLNGKGKTISEQLYTKEELDLMRRYAQVVKMTVIPKYARTNSDTAPALMSALHKYGGAIMTALGYAADSVTGGLAGIGVNALLKRGASAVTDARAARKVGASLSEISEAAPPRPRRPLRITPRIGLVAAKDQTNLTQAREGQR